MQAVSIFEAKTHLSRLVESLVSKKEDQFIISRHGKPVAVLSRLPVIDAAKRIGVAEGCFAVADDIDSANDEIASMFKVLPEGVE